MLFRVKRILGYQLQSTDGEIGKVKEFYFDDRHWAIRYLVLDTGNWLSSRKVLISPHALERVNKMKQTISTNLTRSQVEDSPSLELHKPVSRQYETEYHGYYGYPEYWGGFGLWGYSPYIQHIRRNPEDQADIHLRSTAEVTGYFIEASDGRIGHVDDFLIDEKTWAIRYFIVDTQNWLPGTKVLIATQWIESISWVKSQVQVSLTRDLVRNSPKYVRDTELTKNYERRLFNHYNRQGYWLVEHGPRKKSSKIEKNREKLL